MREVAKSYADRDLKNFAAHYAESAAPPAASDMPAPEAATRCAACHGAAGRDTATPDVPRLAGQKAPYIEQVLREYRSGERKHVVMQAQAAQLADEEIVALAAYYASQAGVFVK